MVRCGGITGTATLSSELSPSALVLEKSMSRGFVRWHGHVSSHQKFPVCGFTPSFVHSCSVVINCLVICSLSLVQTQILLTAAIRQSNGLDRLLLLRMHLQLQNAARIYGLQYTQRLFKQQINVFLLTLAVPFTCGQHFFKLLRSFSQSLIKFGCSHFTRITRIISTPSACSAVTRPCIVQFEPEQGMGHSE